MRWMTNHLRLLAGFAATAWVLTLVVLVYWEERAQALSAFLLGAFVFILLIGQQAILRRGERRRKEAMQVVLSELRDISEADKAHASARDAGHTEIVRLLETIPEGLHALREDVEGVSESIRVVRESQTRSGSDLTAAISALKAGWSEVDQGLRALAEFAEAARVEIEGTASWKKDVTGRLSRMPREVTSEVQAIYQLNREYPTTLPLPNVGGWALKATSLVEIVARVQSVRPGLVLEIGSGASTVWIGMALRALGYGKLVSLEHDERYIEQTRQMLESHGLNAFVDLRLAPLTPVTLGSETYSWYDMDALQSVADVELLLIDGPPKAVGKSARYPALPLLSGRLADVCHIFVDDADRADEKQLVDRWINEFGLTSPPQAGGRMQYLRFHAENARSSQ